MIIFESPKELSWDTIDLPLFELKSDWFASPLSIPPTFSLASDSKSFWLIAAHEAIPQVHPRSAPHQFTPELWKNDCAELFLASTETGQYIEFNLAPNSAWWASKFSSPRKASAHQPDFFQHIRTWHATEAHRWIAAMAIDLQLLKNEIQYPSFSTGNVTFIINSPNQRFVSASKLLGESPDFHQPSSFTRCQSVPLP